MILPTRERRIPAAAACLVAATLTACAATEDAAARAPAVRVLVKLVEPCDDPGAIGAAATRVAGVLVTHAAATSASWHALAVHCASRADCDAAIARLRAADALYQAVEFEGRKARAAS